VLIAVNLFQLLKGREHLKVSVLFLFSREVIFQRILNRHHIKRNLLQLSAQSRKANPVVIRCELYRPLVFSNWGNVVNQFLLRVDGACVETCLLSWDDVLHFVCSFSFYIQAGLFGLAQGKVYAQWFDYE